MDGWLHTPRSNAIVITHEVFNVAVRKRVPLPNVCQQFDLRYQDTFKMLRELEVNFQWRRFP